MTEESIFKIFSLAEKTIVLTGSAGRLGTNFAHALSSAGANVVLVDVDEKKNIALEKILSKTYKTNPTAYSVDISNEKDVLNLTKQIVKKYGDIHGLVNNAFYSPRNEVTRSALPFEKFPLDLWNKVISVN
ncbi:MAG: SDR family NAD(P)-dependent oxidoreductase, partial [Nitrosotalea sp.]